MLTYVREDAIALLTDAPLEAEGEVVAADHDAASEALLEWLHVWLNARKVQPLAPADRDNTEYGDGERRKCEDRKGNKGNVNESSTHLGFWIQREKLLSAFIPVDLIQLVCLPGVLRTQTPPKKATSVMFYCLSFCHTCCVSLLTFLFSSLAFNSYCHVNAWNNGKKN